MREYCTHKYGTYETLANKKQINGQRLIKNDRLILTNLFIIDAYFAVDAHLEAFGVMGSVTQN